MVQSDGPDASSNPRTAAPWWMATLAALPPGRHYGGVPDRRWWVMVGRDLREVDEWHIVPPASSLTLAWGAGGCAIVAGRSSFAVRPGDCMWMGAGVAHRGRNQSGSDFVTLFVDDPRWSLAAQALVPAGARKAPGLVRQQVLQLAALLLRGGASACECGPLLDALLWWAQGVFRTPARPQDASQRLTRAASLLQRPEWVRIRSVAESSAMAPSRLSRDFKRHFHMTPQQYRKQARLALATNALLMGGSITDAAHAACFSDAAHLTRTFRSQYGTSPSNWLQQIGRQAPA